MQEKHLFEYAVIRIVPRVEREEFLNVGIVLFCKKQQFLKVKFHLHEPCFKALFPALDLEEIKLHLQAYQDIAEGKKGSSPIAELDAASRFRWLTATRSTVIQSSKVHPGFCDQLDLRLEKLFSDLVAR